MIRGRDGVCPLPSALCHLRKSMGLALLLAGGQSGNSSLDSKLTIRMIIRSTGSPRRFGCGAKERISGLGGEAAPFGFPRKSKHEFLGLSKADGFERLLLSALAVMCPPSIGKLTKRRRSRLLAAKFLSISAACLSALLGMYIVMEAFDGDLDLWPFGAEDFLSVAHDFPLASGQAAQLLFALPATWCFVMTAGAHLALRHRARSDLPTDVPSRSLAFNMAEPRWRNFSMPLALGRLPFWQRTNHPGLTEKGSTSPTAIVRRVALTTGGRR